MARRASQAARKIPPAVNRRCEQVCRRGVNHKVAQNSVNEKQVAHTQQHHRQAHERTPPHTHTHTQQRSKVANGRCTYI